MLERLSHKQFEEKPLTINNLAEIPDTDFYAIFIVIEAQSRLYQFEIQSGSSSSSVTENFWKYLANKQKSFQPVPL